MQVLNANHLIQILQALKQIQSHLRVVVPQEVEENWQHMIVGGPTLNDWTDGEDVLGKRRSDICERVALQFLQAGDQLDNDRLRVQDLTEVGKPANGRSSHLRLSILQETRVEGQKDLLSLIETDSSRQIHNPIRHEIANPPALVIGEFLDVRQQVCCDFSRW